MSSWPGRWRRGDSWCCASTSRTSETARRGRTGCRSRRARSGRPRRRWTSLGPLRPAGAIPADRKLCGGQSRVRVAGDEPRVVGLGLVDAYAWPTAAYHLYRYARRLRRPESWWNLLAGRSQLWGILRRLVWRQDRPAAPEGGGPVRSRERPPVGLGVDSLLSIARAGVSVCLLVFWRRPGVLPLPHALCASDPVVAGLREHPSPSVPRGRSRIHAAGGAEYPGRDALRVGRIRRGRPRKADRRLCGSFRGGGAAG